MKKTVFLDTNVVIDLLGEREAFYMDAAKIATLAIQNRITIVVASFSYNTVYYTLTKYESDIAVRKKISQFKTIATTSAITDIIIDQGLASSFEDFEDSLQYYCALQENCSIIITRNEADYRKSKIPVMSPKEFLSQPDHD